MQPELTAASTFDNVHIDELRQNLVVVSSLVHTLAQEGGDGNSATTPK